MYAGGDYVQIGPQIWTWHEKWIKFAFSGIFDKFSDWNLAKRTSNLDLASENDENRLFKCIFRAPDAKIRISRHLVTVPAGEHVNPTVATLCRYTDPLDRRQKLPLYRGVFKF